MKALLTITAFLFALSAGAQDVTVRLSVPSAKVSEAALKRLGDSLNKKMLETAKKLWKDSAEKIAVKRETVTISHNDTLVKEARFFIGNNEAQLAVPAWATPTGDSSRKVFTLPADVLEVTDVFVNRGAQIPGEDFTWQGNKIVFTVAVPTWQAVRVKYLKVSK